MVPDSLFLSMWFSCHERSFFPHAKHVRRRSAIGGTMAGQAKTAKNNNGFFSASLREACFFLCVLCVFAVNIPLVCTAILPETGCIFQRVRIDFFEHASIKEIDASFLERV